eukprot:CAMPEP_0176132268 /NCGR_PEP_ID=MMETSP0120_2-20121206/66987_1 /TAXON_ID=160619 /ORGANISM="Kryptoperidinium foliaceum, Strain CCMP 1326" /LENGTH=96 /DNA_ID=CAMNT_0017467707 /DNA_START=274 /DNA_END=560 /DNA_ORIENTATION=-
MSRIFFNNWTCTCLCKYTLGKGFGCCCTPAVVRNNTSICASACDQKTSRDMASITARGRKPIARMSGLTAAELKTPPDWCNHARIVATKSANGSAT